MKKTIIIISILFCYSCSDNKIRTIYEYEGVFVTRIDEGTESHFYYGKYAIDNSLPSSYVRSYYSGRTAGMDAYLIFKTNHIEVYHLMGTFDKLGMEEDIKIINNPKSRTFNFNFDDKVQGNYKHICRVSDSKTHEQELNTKNHSKVKVSYEE
ncbi:MAG: hypothetical protein HYZ42_08645 [Bacteroidetes bacterium]|nr:hypothetical protein [Bacteroidota bacterium]